MAVKKRCPHCNKKMEQIGENQWVCRNHEYPIYVPPQARPDEDEEKQDK